MFPFTPVSVKSEDDEEKPQSSQLHQRQTEQMETGVDGEDCGGAEPERYSDPERRLQPETEVKTEDSSEAETEDSDDWRDTREHQSDLTSVENIEDKRSNKSHTCSECCKSFKKKRDLTRHIRIHTGEKPFSCSECGRRFNQKGSLAIHFVLHREEKPFSCSECGKRFNHKPTLTLHMARHRGEKRYSCSVCDQRFSWSNQLKRHKCAGGQASNPEIYLQAETEVKTENSFEHETEDSDEFWKDTKECRSGVNNAEKMKKAFTYQRHKVLVKDGCCPGERQFGCSEDVAKHELMKHNTVNIDPCNKAEHLQSGLNFLKNKELSVNGGEVPPFDVLACHESSKNTDTLLTQQNSDDGQKPFSCLFCEKRFAMPSVHTREKRLGCIHCEKRFTRESEFISHVCVGESSEPYQGQTEEQITDKSLNCPHCGKGFVSQHNLLVHIKIHSSEEVFSCSVCAQTFASHESLRCHLTHTVKKSFCCTVCNTGFTDGESLIKHMRVHIGQTQFKCSICDQEFVWRRHLTKHMEVHTSEKIYSCIVCDQRFFWSSQLKEHKCGGGQASELHQNQTEEKIEAETGADAEDHEEAEAAMDSDAERHLQPETEDTDGQGTTEHQSGLSTVENIEDKRSKISYTCSECCKSFKKKQDLARHIRIHTGEKPFSCSECNNIFKRKDNLTRHLEVHTGGKPFSCSVCSQRFNHKSVLILHMAHHGGEKPYGCSVCDQRFSLPKQLKNHKCVECSASDLHQNQTEEKREAETRSDGGAEPARDSDPGRHLHPETEVKTEDSSETETEDSDDWRGTRPNKSGLDSLRNVSQSATTFDFCSDSDQTFNNNHLLGLQRNNHTEEKAFSCTGCENQFTERGNVGQHTIAHIGLLRGAKQEEQEPPFIKEEPEEQEVWISQADNTEFRFTPVHIKSEDEEKPRSSQLYQRRPEEMKTGVDGEDCGGAEPERDLAPERHLQIQTEVKTEDSCQSDESVDSDFWKETRDRQPGFKSVENTEEHRPATEKKSNNCSECNKTFLTKWLLNQHMRIHTGEKPFSCSVCNKCFNVKGSLTKHMLLHMGEKPFSCSECGKRFDRRGSLNRHNIVHTGEKPFSCSVCAKRFNQRSSLKRHMAHYRGEKPFSSSDCSKKNCQKGI